MSFSIGVDCEEIERFQRVLDDPKLLKRIFTEAEIEYCLAKAAPKRHLAARFAGKEAIIKALSYRDISAGMSDIEITNDRRGVPHVKVNIKEAEALVVQVSLSHCETVAVAQAFIYSEDSMSD